MKRIQQFPFLISSRIRGLEMNHYLVALETYLNGRVTFVLDKIFYAWNQQFRIQLATLALLLFFIGNEQLVPASCANDITTGLAAHWTFDGNLKDSSGNGHHFEQTSSDQRPNPTTGISDIPNTAFFFDGVNDYFHIIDHPTLRPVSELTITAWVRAPMGFSNRDTVIQKGSNDVDFSLQLWPKDIRFRIFAGGVRSIHKVNFPFKDNTWYHVAGVYDGSAMQVYLNGVPVGAALPKSGNFRKLTRNIFTDGLTIGRALVNNIGDPSFDRKLGEFHGKIDEVRLYHRGLSPEDVRQLFHEEQKAIPSPTIQFVVAESTADESDGNHPIGVQLNVPRGRPIMDEVSVKVIDTRSGTASSGVDYSLFTEKTITFPSDSLDGATEIIHLEIFPDDVTGRDETIILELTDFIGPISPSPRSRHELTITDNDDDLKIYWTEAKSRKIRRSTQNGTHVEDLLTVTGGTPVRPSGMALDIANGKMYWAEASPEIRSIRRANLDGSNVENLVLTGSVGPDSVALDLIHGKMYWRVRGEKKIQRANLDGTGVEDLLLVTQKEFFDLALDPLGGKIYWTDSDSIKRANLDGTDVEEIITQFALFGVGQNVSATGLALDLVHGKMYWTDFWEERILRANLDGTNIEELITKKDIQNPLAIAVDPINGKLYWSRWDTGLLYRANLNGTEIERIATFSGDTKSINLDIANGLVYRDTDENISRANLDGSNVELLLETNTLIPISLALDEAGGRMYFTTYNVIKRAKLDGTHMEDLVTGGFIRGEGIGLDIPGGKMYWGSLGKIQRANLDGSDVENLITSDSQVFGSIAIDPIAGKIYWLDTYTDTIWRANLDGTNGEEVFSQAGSILHLAFNFEQEKIFWRSVGPNTIRSANFDGSNIKNLLPIDLSRARGIALDIDGGKMYWTGGYRSGTIGRANLDGTNIEDVITTGLEFPLGIAVLKNLAPQANDDEITTDQNEAITITVTTNDLDQDGSINPNSVSIVPPRNVASFDGKNDRIIWGHLGLNRTPTISKFIRFRTTDTRAVIFDTQFSSGANGGLFLAGGKLWLGCSFFRSGLQRKGIISDTVAADGKWHSAGFTYDGSVVTVYFDGVPVGTPLAVPNDTIRHNYPSTCGGRVFSNSYFYKGELSDFVIYDKALPAADVMNYHKGNVAITDLVLWGKMDEEDYSDGLADSSGNGHTGTSTGAIPILDPAAPMKPANGTLVNNGDGTVTYTPNSGFSGEDHFEYTVNDNDGTVSNQATVTLRIKGSPVAVDDSVETDVRESITIDVIDNDTDGGGMIDPATVDVLHSQHIARFDGKDDRIIWGHLGLNQTATISKFIRFRTTDTRAVIFDTQFSSGANGGLFLAGGKLWLGCSFFRSGLRRKGIISDTIAADGNWHTAGFTYDGSVVIVYFDGVPVGTPLAVPNDTIRHNYPSTCGGRVFSNSYFYKGELSDFVIYDKTLPAADVMNYHNGAVETTDLVLWGKMDEDDYTDGLMDSSGNGHTGTSTGSIPMLDPAVSMKPANGTVVNNGDGTVTYTPNTGFSGEDSFEYTVKDNDGALSNIAKVTITVQPASTSALFSKFAVKAPKELTHHSMASDISSEEPAEMTLSQSVYEDAEDGTIDGWLVYGDGEVVNVEEASGNRIIASAGDVTGDPFRLGLADHSDWNNRDQFTASFAILMEEEAAVYFRVETTDGEKYLCYRPGPPAIDSNGDVLCFGLNIEPDGQWYTISRDLASDLTTALPSTKLLSVKDLYIYGSLKIDDVILLKR